jgi:hypothetical protein
MLQILIVILICLFQFLKISIALQLRDQLDRSEIQSLNGQLSCFLLTPFILHSRTRLFEALCNELTVQKCLLVVEAVDRAHFHLSVVCSRKRQIESLAHAVFLDLLDLFIGSACVISVSSHLIRLSHIHSFASFPVRMEREMTVTD